MRRAQRLARMAVIVACLLAGLLAQASLERSRPSAHGSPTIEPTLPLVVDLRLDGIEPRGRGGSARLEVALEAASAIERLTLALRLPEGIAALDLPPAAFTDRLRLAAGERRTFVLPLSAARQGAFPIAVEAAYTLPDGRTFRTRHGADLTLGAPAHPGRSHAGAYEVMGIRLEDLGR